MTRPYSILALADPHLKLAGRRPCAQMNVTHERKDLIVALALVRTGNVMARVQR